MASTQAQARKSAVLLFVIALHVGFGVVLILGTAMKYMKEQRQSIIAVDIKPEDKQEVKEPPPPPPDFKPPPVAPPPSTDMPIIRGPPSETALAAPKAPPPQVAKTEEAKPPPPAPVQLTDAGKAALADACASAYPSQSRRLSEEGVAKVEIFVGPDGRATDARIVQSSGFPRLDEANVKCVKMAGKAFVPQKVGGQAVGAWFLMQYRWKLQ